MANYDYDGKIVSRQLTIHVKNVYKGTKTLNPLEYKKILQN